MMVGLLLLIFLQVNVIVEEGGSLFTEAFSLKPAAQGAVIAKPKETHMNKNNSRRAIRKQQRSSQWIYLTAAASSNSGSDEKGEEKGNQPGMEDAFRQLDALESLGDEGKQQTSMSKRVKPTATRQKIDTNSNVGASPTVTPEEEVKMYKEMTKDLEKDPDELYSDILSDIEGREQPPQPTTTTTRTGSSSSSRSDTSSDALLDESTIIADTQPPTLSKDTEEFMNQALEEALLEAKEKTPEEIRSKAGSSILDDKEIMKEIEAIFEKGNEKLLASLEEIRQEQQLLAKESFEKRSKVDVNSSESSEKAQRLAQAEEAMSKMLQKVNQETAEVEKAVRDLERAKEQITSSNPLLSLKEGGLLKQGALVGGILFSIRAVLDLSVSYGVDGEAHLMAAIVQAVLALACILAYVVVL